MIHENTTNQDARNGKELVKEYENNRPYKRRSRSEDIKSRTEYME